MAMKVKGKEQLCVCNDYKKYFKSIQGLGGHILFDRYKDLENIVNKRVSEKYRHFLAQPELDGNTIQWFSEPYYEEPKRLSELKGQEYDYYNNVKKETVSHYRSVIDELHAQNKNSEAEALGNAIKFVNDDFVYCYDGKTVLGVWGMELRDEVREPLGIAMKNTFEKPRKPKPSISGDEQSDGEPETDPDKPSGEDEKGGEEPSNDDNSLLSVRFNADENGSLQGKTDYKMCRGERVSAGMIPEAEADDGFEFVGWDVEPNNHEVVNDVVFTAQFKKKSYKVRFFDGGHGSLLGQTEYDKYYEERVLANEVPKVECDEGYQFIGWDKEPIDYVVKEDTDFVARYEEEKKSWWERFLGWGSGCLNWLLTLLLLGLIGLLLWFLLGNHGFSFCGCDCGCNEQVVVPDTPINPTPDPKIVNPDDPLPPPTENCGVHFSGLVLSDEDLGVGITTIFGNDRCGEYVGQGYYPDNSKTFPKAVQHTFDAIAVDNSTHLIIYSKRNFEGEVLIDIIGPALITNVLWKNDIRYNGVANKTFSPKLQALFPPSRRQWSSGNMHDWSYGSCKIICE